MMIIIKNRIMLIVGGHLSIELIKLLLHHKLCGPTFAGNQEFYIAKAEINSSCVFRDSKHPRTVRSGVMKCTHPFLTISRSKQLFQLII